MAGNLTSQVRGIAKVVTAVADGDLHQKLTVEAKGEIAALAETINSMTDTLATFADQVTTVAREVGVEGKLGGQAKVPGASGTWKGLTENVNELAANLTTQVRAIAEGRDGRDAGRPDPLDHRRDAGEVGRAQGHHQRDDPQPARHDADEHRAGLAEDQPREVSAACCRASATLVTVGQLILSELAPVVGAQQAEVLRAERGAGYAAPAARRELCVGRPRARTARRCISARAWSANAPSTSASCCSPTCRAPASASRPACRSTRALDVLVLPVVFEGQVRGVVGAGPPWSGSIPCTRRSSTSSPSPSAS